MTANVLILSAAGMLVSATSWSVRRRCSRRSVCMACSPALGHRGHHDGDFRIASRVVRHGRAHRRAQNHSDPWFLMRTVDRIGIQREIEPFLNVPVSADLSRPDGGRYESARALKRAQQVTHHLIGVALSLLLIGMFLMVTRKKAITQILALLTVENAVFLVAVGVTTGMPLVVEFGIAFDVMLAVLVLGILVQRIVGRFESMDVSRLSNLKG